MTPDRDALLAEALSRPLPPLDADRDWWRGAIFYEIYVRSFHDGSGDGIGDLGGVIAKLDYLESLGIDGIWLSPVYPSPQRDFGYDITDFRSIDPIHGSLDDMCRLIEDSHARGMKLLLDFIPCHTSIDHPWFQESRRDRVNPRADWYIWADPAPDGGPPNNWLSSFGGSAWEWEPRRAQYYYHPFLWSQPALNLAQTEVLDAVCAALDFWLELGVDGFRLDAIQCLSCDPDLRVNPPRGRDAAPVPFGGGPNNPFTRQEHLFDRDVPSAMPVVEALRRTADRHSPRRVLIGELADVDSARMSVKYTAGEDRLHAVYDFGLINTGHTMEDWVRELKARSDHIGAGWLMTTLTNHDSKRAVSSLTAFAAKEGMRAEAAKLLLFLQTTLRGGGILFQGEELGLPQPRLGRADLRDPWGMNLWPDFEGRDGVRTPLPWAAEAPHGGFTEAEAPWIPLGQGHAELAVDRQEDDPDSVLNFLRALMAWRRSEPFLRVAHERVHGPGIAPLVAYDRYDDRRRLTFLLNFSTTERAMPVTGGRLAALPGHGASRTGTGIRLAPMGFAAVEAMESDVLP